MLLKLNYQQLAIFADNLATCLSAGVEIKQAIRTSSRALLKTAPEFRRVGEEVERGELLSDALRAVEHRLPGFVLPMVVCGEQTGRLDESLRLVATNCRLLKGPAEALRNVWLLPCAIHLGGQALSCVLNFLFGSWGGTVATFSEFAVSVGTVSAIAILVIATPIRSLVDRVKLFVPVLGSAEREISISRFLYVFSMLYGTGGQRVEKMIRHAAHTVSNDWLRHDLLRAAVSIERGSTLPEAFARTTSLTPEEQSELEAGDLAGSLAETSVRIAERTGESATFKFKAVTTVASRIALGLGFFSLLGVIGSLALRFMLGWG